MLLLRMRYLLYVSLLIGLCGVSCASKLRPLKPDTVFAANNLDLALGAYNKVLYHCSVYGKAPLGKKFNLTGILFIKQLPDSSTRVVFQSQMGMTYFDFEWNKDEQFKVVAIIGQMENAALIKTLRKDFEILLLTHYKPEDAAVFSTKVVEKVLRAQLEKAWIDYVFSNGQLIQIQNADDKRVVVDMRLSGVTGNSPLAEKIKINHLRANFKIDMRKIDIIEDDDTFEE